jgi:CIC family chloride channel protein
LRRPQALFVNETLDQALRQLVLYGRDGLPVLSTDGHHLLGWITNQNALSAVSTQLTAAESAITAGHQAAEWAAPEPDNEHAPGAEASGYHVAEFTLDTHSPAIGHTLNEIDWPPGHQPVSILHHRRLREPDPHLRLAEGDRVNVLVPTTAHTSTPAPK